MSAPAKRKPAGSGRSWRAIRQEVTPHAMSKKGRRRQFNELARAVLVFAVIGGLTWGVYALMHSWQSDRIGLAQAVDSEPLGEPMLITDGVLTKAWLKETMALPASASLMSLDLVALRDRLEKQRQVRVAVVTRSFPRTLVVTLQERMPVARLQVQDGAGRPRILLVDRTGAAYEGTGYDREMLVTLPWLKGFTLKRDGDGFAPIGGMKEVAELLATAQTEAPWLYRDWLIVSLARLESHDEIVVTAQDVPELVFSRTRDYFKQIAQLDLIIDRTRDRTEAQLQRVNLAIGNQVAVQFDRPPEQVGALQRPAFNIHPAQKKGKRDL